MSVAEQMLGDRGGDADVRHAPGADLADHLDRPLALTWTPCAVMPRRVALELLGITELLLASLTKVHELFHGLLWRLLLLNLIWSLLWIWSNLRPDSRGSSNSDRGPHQHG